MFDQELFEKITSCQCSEEELEAFCIDIDQKEFDTENAFTKYYRFDYILHCITLYQNKKISQTYLARWAYAYNWIIMGGFEGGDINNPLSVKKLLIWNISDWLDSLIFFDKKYDIIDYYIQNFKKLDYLYQTESQWRMIYKIEDPCATDYTFLLINDSTKQYHKIFMDDMDVAVPSRLPLQLPACTENFFVQTEQDCEQKGYIEL
jgi:hypothetical protein